MPVAVVAGNVDCEVCYSDMIGTVVTMVQTVVQRVDILAQMVMLVLFHLTTCGLRGCEIGPAPFPLRKS